MEVIDEFSRIPPEDLWVYNKLQLSSLLGHLSGPIGVNVPKAGYYIIRPAINFMGMGRNARKIWLEPDDDTTNFGHPGEFWCEYFNGEHVSVDFCEGYPVLVVKGTREESEHATIEQSRWKKWEKINRWVKFPRIFHSVASRNRHINIETIGGRIIEAHFRTNPDFVWGNEVAIPVYDHQTVNPPDGFTYVESPDYTRKGFYVK